MPPTVETPTAPYQLERLDRLIAKTAALQASQSDPLSTVDLRHAGPRAGWMPDRAVARIIGEIIQGESVALRLCTGLLDATDDPRARAFLSLQRADERRHVAAYRRYADHLGLTKSGGDAMPSVERAAMAAPGGPIGQMVICHLVLESEAIRLHDELSDLLRCPALDAINVHVAPDEARHVAFGTLYLRQHVAALDAPTKRAIGTHAERTWRQAARIILGETVGARLIPKRVIESRLDRAWLRHKAALSAMDLV